MTYTEALTKAYTVRWKTQECTTPDCWCKLIIPEEPIPYDDGIGDHIDYIVGSGAIHSELAEHIVKIHNEYLSTKK